MDSENSLIKTYPRTLKNKVIEISKTFPIVLILGPRQVGKTTLFKQCLEKENSDRKYISLDDVQIRSLAKNDPELFLETYKFPLLIDEVQYAPELFPYLKIIADREHKNGIFWLTGSQQFSLMQNVSESLAGRVGILNLQGLSQAEIEFNEKHQAFLPENDFSNEQSLEQTEDINSLYKHILRGSYPALYANPETDAQIFYSSYVQTYLERDVQSILNVSNQHAFLEFLQVCAARTGQILNYSEIAKDVGISVNTAKNWLSVLESSGIVYLLRPYSKNITSRTIKSPKLYFFDTGLCCYLTGWKDYEALRDGIMNGAILETYVISEIIKTWIHNGLYCDFYFYRDSDGREIDLLIQSNGKLFPVEIKRSAKPELSMAKNFSALEKLETGKGAIICLYKNFLPLSRNLVSIPVWKI